MQAQVIIIDSHEKRDKAAKWLARIPVDEVLELSLRPYKPTRSEQQNRRYWLILSKISDATGHDKDELHYFFKQKFLGMQETEVAGETLAHQRPSSNLKVKEFAEYSERVEQFMVDKLGLWIE
jgi:hypothetical protein